MAKKGVKDKKIEEKREDPSEQTINVDVAGIMKRYDRPQSILIPLIAILLLAGVFAATALNRQGDEARDSAVFSLFFLSLAVFYALWMLRFVRLSTASIATVFITALVIHMMPAYTPGFDTYRGVYISDLDSYYWYRHANTAFKTGFIPERENKVYPVLPPYVDAKGNLNSTLDFYTQSMQWSTLMASTTTVMSQFGYTVHDIAILEPGIIAAFAILLFYLLLKEAFWEIKPHNYAVAVLGAAMLMMNPAFASRAIATNSEDDTFGMFLTIAFFILFTMSYRKKSLPLSFLAGFSFMLLSISWAGYSYAFVVLAVFAVLYAMASFLRNKSAVEHIPYFAIPMLMSTLAPIVLHQQGHLDLYYPIGTILSVQFLAPFGGAIIVAFVLEMIRKRFMGGTVRNTGTRLEDKMDLWMDKLVYPVGVVMVLFFAYYVFVLSTPSDVIGYAMALATGAKQSEILGMTTAEQRELCITGDASDCVKAMVQQFGIEVIYGLLMILPLAYLLLFKRSFGSAFILAWSLPIMYGVMFRSQYQFIASAPAVALGATIGLITAVKRKDFETWRVVGFIPLLGLPALYLLLYGGVPVFGSFGGASPMYMGATYDRILWNNTLGWLGQQPNNIITLTWWDYGHWISSMSDRISILDNVKAERFQVQDIARWHVVSENDTEALDIARKYNATYVAIDYTMIGKSGAPHFISTSGLGEYIPAKKIGAKVSCAGGQGCNAILVDDGSNYASVPVNTGSIVIDYGTVYDINSSFVMLAPGAAYKYVIESSLDGNTWQKILDKTGGEYKGLQADTFKDVKARYVRLTGTYASDGGMLRVSRFRLYNPRYEGSYMGYGQCQFDPASSVIKPVPVQNDQGGFDMVSSLVFGCNTNYMSGVLFEIKNGKFSADGVYAIVENGRSKVPWKSWTDATGASILGIQSLHDILGNALAYPDKYANFPTFTTLVYVPKDKEYDMNKVMMTKTYLGDYLEEYQSAGLASSSIQKSSYYTLVDGFKGDKADNSYWGYVRVYKINYPELASTNATTIPSGTSLLKPASS